MSILVIAATIALGLLALVWTLLRHRRGHGPRVIVRGLGVVALLAGLYLSGLSGLVGNGVRSIIDWANRTALNLEMQIGFGLLAFGVLMVIIGSVIRPRTREQAKAVRDQRRGKAVGGPVAATSQRKAPAPAVAVDEDDEIAAILSKRGIN